MFNKFCQLVTLIAIFSASCVGFAQEEPPQIVGIRVGFEGRYKVGLWTPVEIRLQCGNQKVEGTVTLTTPDGDGVPSRVTTSPDHPVRLTPGDETSVLLYARYGHVDNTSLVQFTVDGREIARREFASHDTKSGADYYKKAMLATQRLFLIFGEDDMGVSQAVSRTSSKTPESDAAVVCLSNFARLPERWYGYEGVEAVLISTSRFQLYSQFSGPTDARLAALNDWIRMGGRMVLAAGANAADVLTPDKPLAGFAPGRLTSMVNLHHSRGWEAYADGSAPFGKGSVKMSAPRLANIKGNVEAQEADLPLVVHTPRAFGQIVFVAADLDRPPLSDWPDRARLLARILGTTISSDENDNAYTAVMHYGYDDLAGQLRSALDHFTGVSLVPFGVVVALAILYIALIGPVDYFFLKKIVGRMQLTWITFPLIVAAFCLGTYYLAYYLKGNQIRVSQVDLIDVDTTTSFMRGTIWSNIFSPSMQTYDISYQPLQLDGRAAENARPLCSWFGLPGSGLGGMNQPVAAGSAWRIHYDFTPSLDAMLGVPIPVWSTKSITARWQGDCRMSPKAQLSSVDGLLDGRISNTLDFPLHNCLVAFGRWVYEFDTIEPGQSVRIADARQYGTLQTLLTGRHRVMDDDRVRQKSTPYNVASTDIPYILRQMMFHKAAGGKSYAHLSHQYQSFVDMSELITLNRAVLVAYGPSPDKNASADANAGRSHAGAELLLDGRPIDPAGQQHTTIYRFVFEVTARDKNAKSY